MKPIGYYVSSHTPGDGGLLEEMQEAWGAQFQQLTNVERLWMIVKLAEDACAEISETDDDDVDESVEQAMTRLDELSTSSKVGLILAVVNQIRGI
jgi:hypothetical protein